MDDGLLLEAESRTRSPKFRALSLIRSCVPGPIFLLSCSLVLTSGCSLFKTKRKVVGRPASQTEKAKDSSVSKSEYEELKKKYEQLLAEKEKNQKPPMAPKKSTAELINDLTSEGHTLVETVDVYSNQPNRARPAKKIEMPKVIDSLIQGEVVEKEIVQLRKAYRLINSKKYNRALRILKRLENSQILQIKVRTKYYLGLILFQQKEYDLGLQIFEDIIRHYAFSGIVLKALEKLIICTEKLKLESKRKRYHSLRYDLFESA